MSSTCCALQQNLCQADKQCIMCFFWQVSCPAVVWQNLRICKMICLWVEYWVQNWPPLISTCSLIKTLYYFPHYFFHSFQSNSSLYRRSYWYLSIGFFLPKWCTYISPLPHMPQGTHIIPLHLTSLIIFGEQWTVWSSLLRCFPNSHHTSSSIHSEDFISTPFLNTPSLSESVRNCSNPLYVIKQEHKSKSKGPNGNMIHVTEAQQCFFKRSGSKRYCNSDYSLDTKKETNNQ